MGKYSSIKSKLRRRKRWNKKPHSLWDKVRKERFPLGCEVEAKGNSYKPRIRPGDRGFLIGRRTKHNTMVLIVRFGSKEKELIFNAVEVIEKYPQQRIKEQRDYYKALTGE